MLDLAGAISSSGYGEVRHQRKTLLCHRVSYEIYKGEIPQGLCILHKICDNPLCINPDHLLAGTIQENIADMVSKNRQAKGNRNGRAKLSDSSVLEIRTLYKAQHLTLKELSNLYRISTTETSNIVKGITWNLSLAS